MIASQRSGNRGLRLALSRLCVPTSCPFAHAVLCLDDLFPVRGLSKTHEPFTADSSRLPRAPGDGARTSEGFLGACRTRSASEPVPNSPSPTSSSRPACWRRGAAGVRLRPLPAGPLPPRVPTVRCLEGGSALGCPPRVHPPSFPAICRGRWAEGVTVHGDPLTAGLVADSISEPFQISFVSRRKRRIIVQ